MQIFFCVARQYVNSPTIRKQPRSLQIRTRAESFDSVCQIGRGDRNQGGEERRRMAFPVGLSPDFEVIANITGWDWWKMWSWDWHQLHAAEKATRKTQKNDGRKALSRRISDADIGSMGKFDSFGHSFGQNQHRYILQSHCIFNG